MSMNTNDSILNIMRKYEAESLSGGTRLIDHGQINEMVFPAGWAEREVDHTVVGTSSLRIFSPEGKPDVKLCFYYRGRHISRDAGDKLRSILDTPEHVLTAMEIDSIGDVLEEKRRPQDFELHSVRTAKLNSKLVLIVEGRWKQIAEQIEAIYIDANGKSTAIQEIFYQAPALVYKDYLPDVRAALDSIEWKSHTPAETSHLLGGDQPGNAGEHS